MRPHQKFGRQARRVALVFRGKGPFGFWNFQFVGPRQVSHGSLGGLCSSQSGRPRRRWFESTYPSSYPDRAASGLRIRIPERLGEMVFGASAGLKKTGSRGAGNEIPYLIIRNPLERFEMEWRERFWRALQAGGLLQRLVCGVPGSFLFSDCLGGDPGDDCCAWRIRQTGHLS